jgi:hypothetical protein
MRRSVEQAVFTRLRKAVEQRIARQGGQAMTVDEAGAAARLVRLRTEHRDLDAAIDALLASAATDQLQVARLKKRKLRLRDEIALLEDQLIPDIIA